MFHSLLLAMILKSVVPRRAETLSPENLLEMLNFGEFPGGPVVRTLRFHCHVPRDQGAKIPISYEACLLPTPLKNKEMLNF